MCVMCKCLLGGSSTGVQDKIKFSQYVEYATLNLRTVWSAGGVIGQDTQELLNGMPMKRYFERLVKIIAHSQLFIGT